MSPEMTEWLFYVILAIAALGELAYVNWHDSHAPQENRPDETPR